MYVTKKKPEQPKNPALAVSNFYYFSLTIINEINFARTSPRQYAEKLEKIKSTISKQEDKNTLYVKHYPYKYSNLEYELQKAIEFLKSQATLPGLLENENITKSADELLNFLILHDGIKMDDINNTRYSLENRMKSFGEPLGELFELIDYGMFEPEYVVMNFILCDGQKDKAEREVIFNAKITKVGVSCGILPSDRICTVINFAENYCNPGEILNAKERSKYQTKTVSLGQGSVSNHTSQQQTQKESGNNGLKRKQSGDIFKQKRAIYLGKNKNIEEEDEIKESDDKGSEDNVNEDKDGNKKDVDDFGEDDFPDGVVEIKTMEKIIQDSNNQKIKLVKKIYTYEDGTVKTELVKKPVTVKKK